jgi:fatty-acyl-CoA synthase
MVKSGGEWISSIDLENIAQAHPAIQEAAVVARPDSRWGERPVLVAVLKPGATFNRADMRAHYEGKTSKWCVPDDVIIVDELRHTAAGKLSKKDIRRIVLESPGPVFPDLAS